jgi:hypothetical protein
MRIVSIGEMRQLAVRTRFFLKLDLNQSSRGALGRLAMAKTESLVQFLPGSPQPKGFF